MNDVASLVGSVKDYQGLECVVYHNSKNEKKKKGGEKKETINKQPDLSGSKKNKKN